MNKLVAHSADNLSNEQMAIVLRWTRMDDGRYFKNEKPTGFSSNPESSNYFNPLFDLNHVALVEKRMRDLNIEDDYVGYLWYLVMQGTSEADRRTRDYRKLLAQRIAYADARTKCEAAYFAWSRYQKNRPPSEHGFIP